MGVREGVAGCGCEGREWLDVGVRGGNGWMWV